MLNNKELKTKYVFEVIGMGAKKYGGFEKYIVEEARQLREKGYKLIVIFSINPLSKDYIDDLHTLGVETFILPHDSKIKFIKGFWNLLKKYKPRVVHTNFSSNGFYVHALCRIRGVRTHISTQHCHPNTSSLRMKIIYQFGVFLSQKKLVVSKQGTNALKEIIKFGKRKIDTLYLGVEDFQLNKEIERQNLKIDKNITAIINIAYHNPIKGVDVLIEAMNIIVNERNVKDIILFQVGGGQTGNDTNLLLEKAKNYNLNQNIIWLGIRNDVPNILTAGDIYVQPSRSEGLPLSIMEASLARLPIVATKVGGIPEVATNGENAILVPSEDPHSLAEALIHLYNEKNVRLELGCKGREMALKNFVLKSQVKKLITEYYKL